VWPDCLHDVVARLWRDYRLPIEVTESGCAYNEWPGPEGAIHDQRRIDFYDGYLRALHRAIAEGADVRSFHAWTLLDNFEWHLGYNQRFGLVYVDFPSQRRTIKDAGRWFAGVAAANALP
jgi:beta-glucosidase